MSKSHYFMAYLQDRYPENIRMIPEGFSFMAAIFGCFWFFYHRLWFSGLTVLAIELLFLLMEQRGILPSALLNVLRTLYIFSLGFFARDIQGYILRLFGYTPVAVVIGLDETQARLRFLEAWKSGEQGISPNQGTVPC